MRRPKYFTSGFLIIFLMLYILSAVRIDLSYTYHYNMNLNEDDNSESWSRIIESGRRLYSPSIELIDNYTYIIGNIGEYYTEFDIYLAKYNSSGAKLWEQTWGGSEFNHIINHLVDSENNLYIVGITNTFFLPHSGDVFLVKYNTTGNLLWATTIELPRCHDLDDTLSINADLNNSIYISCVIPNSINEKILIIKINPFGEVLWTHEIELSGWISKLITTIDSIGNIYIYGQQMEYLFLLKLNSSGSMLWYYELGEREYGYHLKLDFDENIIITGTSYNSGINKKEIWIMKMNNSGNVTKKIICASFEGDRWRTPKFEVWFLDNIFVLTGSSLLEYNYSLNCNQNFTLEDDAPIESGWNLDFGINSQQEMYLVYLNYGDVYILRFNNSKAILSNFTWGGPYNDYFHEIAIGSQDDLYMLCTIKYVNIWKEYIDVTILVKNPRSDGKPPQLNHLIDDRDIFIFSLLGVMCFISVILIYTTLKPKFRMLVEK